MTLLLVSHNSLSGHSCQRYISSFEVAFNEYKIRPKRPDLSAPNYTQPLFISNKKYYYYYLTTKVVDL